MSGRRRPAGRGAAEVGGSSGGPGPAPEPSRGLARRSPAQERVFQIFSSRMTMAARWDRSPVSRKMFMAAAAVGAAPGGSAAQAAAAAAAAPERKRRRWRERARRGQGRGQTAGARAGQPGKASRRQAPPWPRPLKGTLRNAGRAGSTRSRARCGGPRLLANSPMLGFRLLLGCQRFPFNF